MSESTSNIKILHISDTHFGAHDEKKQECLRKFSSEWKPDIIFITGDIFDSPMHWRNRSFAVANLFIQSLRDTCRDGRLLMVPGNHDTLFGRTFFKKHWPKLQAKENFVEYFHLEERGVCVIGIDSTCISWSSLNNRGDFSHSTETYLRTELEAVKKVQNFDLKSALKIALIHHHPMPTLSSKSEGMLYLKNSGRFMKFVADYDIDFVLHGHQHDPNVTVMTFGSSQETESFAILSAGSCIKREDELQCGHFYAITVGHQYSIARSYFYHAQANDYLIDKEYPITKRQERGSTLVEIELEYAMRENGDMFARETRKYRRDSHIDHNISIIIGVDESADGCATSELDLKCTVDDISLASEKIEWIVDEPRCKQCLIPAPKGRIGQHVGITIEYTWPGGFSRLLSIGNDKGEIPVLNSVERFVVSVEVPTSHKISRLDLFCSNYEKIDSLKDSSTKKSAMISKANGAVTFQIEKS